MIYVLIGGFVVYQALPDRCVPDRNNDLFFNKIHYLFAANMGGNAAWIFIFQTNSEPGFIISFIFITGLLVTAVMIMNIADQGRLSVVGMITLRIGFSIYSGWLTAATILNSVALLKAFGVDEDTMSIDETNFGMVILCVACGIYMAAGYFYRNPAYAVVFIWVLIAIRDT